MSEVIEKRQQDALKRREQLPRAWELYLQGWSYREIAAELGHEHHLNVYNWIKGAAKELSKQQLDSMDEQRGIIGAQLDRIIKTGMRDLDQSVVISGSGKDRKSNLIDRIDPNAAHATLEALKAKIKLFGISKPEVKTLKIEHSLADLLRLAGTVTEEEIHEAQFKPVEVDDSSQEQDVAIPTQQNGDIPYPNQEDKVL